MQSYPCSANVVQLLRIKSDTLLTLLPSLRTWQWNIPFLNYLYEVRGYCALKTTVPRLLKVGRGKNRRRVDKKNVQASRVGCRCIQSPQALFLHRFHFYATTFTKNRVF